ncbi:hypothetical protein D3C76_690610 [compost metagenome]|jgi:hypothetical protein
MLRRNLLPPFPSSLTNNKICPSQTLEDHFAIDFVDYDSYRYFQPDGYDVFLKRKAKGRGDKVPLTIGMLYRAIKAQRWDTDELESL